MPLKFFKIIDIYYVSPGNQPGTYCSTTRYDIGIMSYTNPLFLP